MTPVKYTDHIINNNKYLSAGWSHDSNYFRFPRTLSEAGIKSNLYSSKRKSWYEIFVLLLSAFVVAFILTGVAIHGV